MKNFFIKIFFIFLIIYPSILFSFDDISLDYSEEKGNINNKKYYYTIPDTAFKSKDSYLPVFSVDCNGIKYTGAYEQVFIDYLKDIKTYLKEIVEPYTTLSKMDAAIYSYTFGKCLTKGITDEITGSLTSSNIGEKTIEAVGKSNSAVIIGEGMTGSYQGSAGYKTEVTTNFDEWGTGSKINEIAEKDGMYDQVVRCMMKEREDIYLTLYNILSYSLKIQWITTSAINKQCSLDLRKKDEVVPSWTEMTGINTQEYVDKLWKNNQFKLSDKNGKFGKFMNDYFDELFQFDVQTNSNLCVDWDSENNICKDSVEISRKACVVDENGYVSGGCDCVQGVNIYTGKKCSLPTDYKLNNEYGINVNSAFNSIAGIKISKIEENFIKVLKTAPYNKSEIPYSLFFNNDLILFNWAIPLENSKITNINLLPEDNFDLKTNYFNNTDLENIDLNEILLRDKNGKYIYKTSDFSNKLLLRLAFLECGKNTNGVCSEDIIKYKKVDNLENIIKTFNNYKKLYKSKIDITDNIYNFNINDYNYKLKIKQQYDSIKTMFSVEKLYRIIKLKNNFFYNWVLTTKKLELEYKFNGKSAKDIDILDNFSKKMLLSMDDTSNINYDVFSKQIYDMENQNYKQREMNLMFMKTNSEIEKQKMEIIKNLF